MERLLRLHLLFSFTDLRSLCALSPGCPRYTSRVLDADVPQYRCLCLCLCLGRAVVDGLFQEVHSSRWKSGLVHF